MAWRNNIPLQLSTTSLASLTAAECYIRPPILFPLAPPFLDQAVVAGFGGIHLGGPFQMPPPEIFQVPLQGGLQMPPQEESEEPLPPGVGDPYTHIPDFN